MEFLLLAGRGHLVTRGANSFSAGIECQEIKWR